MEKHKNLILALLAVAYAIIIMAWPDADFSKEQFLTTGETILAIIAGAMNGSDVLIGLATRYDFKREVHNMVRLLRAKGVLVPPELEYLAGEVVGAVDKIYEEKGAATVVAAVEVKGG